MDISMVKIGPYSSHEVGISKPIDYQYGNLSALFLCHFIRMNYTTFVYYLCNYVLTNVYT